MRIPKPKSAPGLLLYGITAVAVVLLAKVGWVLVDQNIETVSTQNGYDRLLSRHWVEIMNWMASNGFWLSLITSSFIGATVALWGNVVLQTIDSRNKNETSCLLMERIYSRIDQAIDKGDTNYRPDIAGEINAVFRRLDQLGIMRPAINWTDGATHCYKLVRHYLGPLTPMIREDDIAIARREMPIHINDMGAIPSSVALKSSAGVEPQKRI